VATFSGKGLVPDAVTTEPLFLGSVGLAAALTVAVATRVGMPISTTHALIGGLVGAGWVWAGPELAIGHLGKVFLLPLATSPLLAMAATLPLYMAARAGRLGLGVQEDTCVCVGAEVREPALAGVALREAAASGPLVTASTGHAEDCRRRYQGQVLGIEAQPALDAAHFVSAGAVGFARGLNDAPKIAALLMLTGGVAALQGFAGVAIAMAVGGWLASRRVAQTVSYGITGMNAGQGFVANLVTAALVSGASWIGVPVSTTHVSVGALFGVGVASREGHWRTIATVISAWVLTLPFAAAMGIVLALLLRALV